MIFIGDVHGRFDALAHVTQNEEREYFQLGDLGVGFPRVPYPAWLGNNFRFLRGNHDAPTEARGHVNYAGDWGYIKKHGLFYVSGAWSIDAAYRTAGWNWWPEEELSQDELNQMLDCARTLAQKNARVDVIATHDCPPCVFEAMFPGGGVLSGALGAIPSRTTTALEELRAILRPQKWLFGHHHCSWRGTIEGTEFICLNELETLEVLTQNTSTI